MLNGTHQFVSEQKVLRKIVYNIKQWLKNTLLLHTRLPSSGCWLLHFESHSLNMLLYALEYVSSREKPNNRTKF